MVGSRPTRPSRRSPPRRRRTTTAGDRRAPTTAPGESGRGQCTTTTPSPWALRQRVGETDQRRAAPAARRPDDEDVLAVGHLELRRAERGEVDADRQRRDAAHDGSTPAATPRRRRRRGRRSPAGRLRRRRRQRAGGTGRTASWASSRRRRRRCGPGSPAARRGARTPSAAHSIGSSTWNSHRCGSAASAAWATPPGRSTVATVWIPAATPSVRTREQAAVFVAVGGRRHGGEQRAEPVDGQDDRPTRHRWRR